ncbi:methyltransferase domain-containing protein [Pedobacter sp. LMG 31464]|uniref:Methyltransferase domain-containing protein n=1 Tax=Pedobacter planticolens TaxID=2679964 RepID=A0A923E267_9SPHI|nr:class I SAM-dependent methyltransferase [Pedobacter planticolens]MBB2146673.1 methyltransferase domain-containing protein [Pedobacter planticolens]
MHSNSQFSYDKIAKRYDFLSRLVFFKAQVNAQINQLPYLNNCTHILIVGGGTGWILKHLDSLKQTMQIVYVETSLKMIELAKKIETKNRVHFVHVDIEKFQHSNLFDAVLTPFLFDNFDNEKAKNVFNKINTMLIPNAIWLYTDFYVPEKGGAWKKAILKSMHIFFRVINVVNVTHLVNVNSFFANVFTKIEERGYYANFIKAIIYRKTSP